MHSGMCMAATPTWLLGDRCYLRALGRRPNISNRVVCYCGKQPYASTGTKASHVPRLLALEDGTGRPITKAIGAFPGYGRLVR